MRNIFALVGAATVTFLTDWMWFGEVGYRPVYATELTARAALGTG